ncbi:hypothetical protein PUN28_019704 [Cardiocondyla obscurior]|uniref:Uncharacterized protein n=1 Tax=Cardiocondyla obscurior TaxID=286306 RepID=A0AAW2EFY0_9HYME
MRYFRDQSRKSLQRVRISKSFPKPLHVAKEVMEPEHPFSRIVRMAVTVKNVREFVKTMRLFIERHVEIFPHLYMSSKTNYVTYCVVNNRGLRHAEKTRKLLFYELHNLKRVTRTNVRRKRISQTYRDKVISHIDCTEDEINVSDNVKTLQPTSSTGKESVIRVKTLLRDRRKIFLTTSSSSSPATIVQVINFREPRKGIDVSCMSAQATAREAAEAAAVTPPLTLSDQKKEKPKILSNVLIVPPIVEARTIFNDRMDQILGKRRDR